MENLSEDTINISQEDYTFPNLIPSSKCKELLHIVNAKINSPKFFCWLALGTFMLFMILTIIFWILSITNSAYLTSTIICAVLCVISIIAGIISFVFWEKYDKDKICLTKCIKINTQYSTFINQGYDKKEAYKLTLEWIDRQANLDALNDVASISAIIAATFITHI